MIRWRGEVLLEGEWTTDGRLVEPGVTWNEPLPVIRYDEHVGTIERVWRHGQSIWAEGTGPDDNPEWRPTADVRYSGAKDEGPGPDGHLRMRMSGVELVGVHALVVAGGVPNQQVWPGMRFEVISPAGANG